MICLTHFIEYNILKRIKQGHYIPQESYYNVNSTSQIKTKNWDLFPEPTQLGGSKHWQVRRPIAQPSSNAKSTCIDNVKFSEDRSNPITNTVETFSIFA